MPTERSRAPALPAAWCLLCAVVLVAQIFTLTALPAEIREPWDKVWHALAYAGLTLLLWMATDGRRPAGVVVTVMLLGGLDELRQGWIPGRSADATDLLVDLCAAAATGGALLWLTRGSRQTCAESSPR